MPTRLLQLSAAALAGVLVGGLVGVQVGDDSGQVSLQRAVIERTRGDVDQARADAAVAQQEVERVEREADERVAVARADGERVGREQAQASPAPDIVPEPPDGDRAVQLAALQVAWDGLSDAERARWCEDYGTDAFAAADRLAATTRGRVNDTLASIILGRNC